MTGRAAEPTKDRDRAADAERAPRQRETGHAEPAPSPQQTREERKSRVLTHTTPAITPSIADAIVVKDEALYFLCTRDGRVPLDGTHGFGLYYHDCRFLDGYEMQLAGTAAAALAATAARGYMATLELANGDIRMADGQLIRKESVGVTWERVADGARRTLHDRIAFANYEQTAVRFPVTLAFRARFEDIFVVRGMLPEHTGDLHPPSWRGDVLEMTYDGIDHVRRAVQIRFSPAPAAVEGTTATFALALPPRARAAVRVTITLSESGEGEAASPSTEAGRDVGAVISTLRNESDRWMERHTLVRSDSVPLERVLDRSLRDLHMLRTRLDGSEFIAAGVPWFVTLFGRDSAITAIQSLAFDRRIAEHTLRVLTKFQGTTVDQWREEQPGKILHELRVGELTRARKVPYSPYYGTIDATPLFLILLGRHAEWTGDLALFEELGDNVRRALEWIDRYGDLDGDGYVEYQSTSSEGLVNQGWKDSGDAIVDADGRLATPPIALVEVQGYVFLAKRLMADLYRRSGARDRADELERDAAALRERFNRDFWLEDKGCYALALQRGNRPAAVISSNPGQALWTGIADQDKARRTAERLMADDMFSGWGIRTLSTGERRYNPIGYHLGTVWPHDNALIAAGFRRYGFDDAVLRIFAGLTAAAMEFEHYRLPELFAGFSRADFEVPVSYPVADHPQAWGAGSVPYLLETMLGLIPEGFDGRLRVVHPLLPDFVDRIEVRGLRIGRGSVDLWFRRSRRGVEVDVLDARGGVDVVVEPGDRGQHDRRTRVMTAEGVDGV